MDNKEFPIKQYVRETMSRFLSFAPVSRQVGVFYKGSV